MEDVIRKFSQTEQSPNEFDKKREFYNDQIIQLLSSYLQGKGRHLRFCQLLSSLNADIDYFYEEPEETYVRMIQKLKELDTLFL